MKSFYCLASFAWYCITHRHERFWQALRNWSGARYIVTAQAWRDDKNEYVGTRDTFEWEGRNERDKHYNPIIDEVGW